MDVLLKRGEYKEDGDAEATGDASDWAPRQFLCPITQALVMDPVVAADGHRQGDREKLWLRVRVRGASSAREAATCSNAALFSPLPLVRRLTLDDRLISPPSPFLFCVYYSRV